MPIIEKPRFQTEVIDLIFFLLLIYTKVIIIFINSKKIMIFQNICILLCSEHNFTKTLRINHKMLVSENPVP